MDDDWLQFKRLRRHYEVVVRTYDPISLLDLAHTLRIWADLKQSLPRTAPAFSRSTSFKTGLPAKKLMHAAKGRSAIFCCLPDGVVTYASQGTVLTSPENPPTEGEFSLSVLCKRNEDSFEFAYYAYIYPRLDERWSKAPRTEAVKRCTYFEWLGSETVRVSGTTPDGVFEWIKLSRENMIRSVANTKGGSHPVAEQTAVEEKLRDGAVRDLMRYKVGGLPLPYFILLKIAQDILHTGAQHFSGPERA